MYCVTSCYECQYFVANGLYDCQANPRPIYSPFPTDEPGFRFSVPCPVTWRTPDGTDTHCTSFVQKFKDTLF